jgi:hypothetical protein
MNTRDRALALGLAAVLLSSAPTSAQLPAGNPPVVPKREVRDGSRDFDFVVGRWKVRHRRLRNPLTGSSTWVEFDGTSVGRLMWDGRVSQDENVFNDPAGTIEGMTVRFYNVKTGQWSIYWASNTLGGLALPPTVGSFDRKEGRGEFFDQENWNGRIILVRYLWHDIKADSCRWEQAFSEDGGATWETNWIQYLERVRD